MYNFDELPEDVRNKLSLKLAATVEEVFWVAVAIVHHFDKLPEDVWYLMFKLHEKDASAGAVYWILASKFGKILNDLTNID